MKYIAVFLRKTDEKTKYEKAKYDMVGKKEFTPTAETVELKLKDQDEKPVKIYIKEYSYIDTDKGVRYYFYDLDTGDTLSFTTLVKAVIHPDDMKHFTRKHTFENIIRAMKAGNISWLIMILPVIFLIVGIVIGHFVFPQPTVYIPTNSTVPTV